MRDLRMMLVTAAVLVTIWDSRMAQAGGFEHPDNGAAALARGGAFAAKANDLTALQYNPAGLAVNHGTVLYYSHNLSRQNLDFTPLLEDGSRGATESNKAGWFYAPFVGVSTDVLHPDVRVALGAFGPSAMGAIDYGRDGVAKYMTVNSEMVLAYYTAALSWSPRKDLDVGLSLHWVDLQRTKFTIAVNGWFDEEIKYSDESYNTYSTIDVSDRFGMFATAGLLWRPVTNWTIGASFRAPTADIDARGDIDLDFAGETIGSLYESGVTTGEGLVPYDGDGNTVTKLPARLRFTLPMVARLGLRYAAPDPRGWDLWDLEGNVVWEGWSTLKEFRVDVDGYMKLVGSGVTNANPIYFKPIVIKRNFNDAWSFRLGSTCRPWELLGFSLGGYFEDGATPRAYSNIDFPSFNRFGVGTGLTLYWRMLELTASYSHSWQETRNIGRSESEVSIQFPLSDEAPLPQHVVGAGRFESSYDVISTSLTIKL